MNDDFFRSLPETLFAVDYDRRPFCFVRAGDFESAMRLAERLLATVLRDEPGLGTAPAREIAKLRARRPSDSERYQFAAKAQRDGVVSPYVAAVLADGRPTRRRA